MIEVFCDGGARGNPGPAAWGFVVKKGDALIKRGYGYIGIATNNFAEYTACVKALAWVGDNFQKEHVQLYLDSKLVVSQLTGEYKIKNANLKRLAVEVKELEKQFAGISYNHVPREQNKEADKLVNIALNKIIHGA